MLHRRMPSSMGNGIILDKQAEQAEQAEWENERSRNIVCAKVLSVLSNIHKSLTCLLVCLYVYDYKTSHWWESCMNTNMEGRLAFMSRSLSSGAPSSSLGVRNGLVADHHRPQASLIAPAPAVGCGVWTPGQLDHIDTNIFTLPFRISTVLYSVLLSYDLANHS